MNEQTGAKEFLEAVEFELERTEGHWVLGPGEPNEFSAATCDLCGTYLAGSRHPAAIIQPGTDAQPIECEVCEDCVMFLANGDIPENWRHH